MAISFVGASAQDAQTDATAATFEVTLNPTLPTLQENDLIIIFVVVNASANPSITTPTGYTERASISNSNWQSSDDCLAKTFYKIATSSESNPSITCSGLSAEVTANAQIAVYRGVDTVSPFDITSPVTSSTTGPGGAVQTFTPTGITTLRANAWAISAVATPDDNALNYSNQQSFNDRMSGANYDHTIGKDMSVGWADKEIASPGAVTMPTWNQSVNNNDNWSAISDALRPAGFLIDSVSSTNQVGGSSMSWNHTCGGAERLLVVCTAAEDQTTAADLVISSITYNGDNLTKIRSDEADYGAAGADNRSEIWYMVNPDAGTNSIVVTYAGAVGGSVGGAISFTGAAQTNQPNSNAGNQQSGDVGSVSVNISTTADGCFIVDSICGSLSVNTNTPDASQTERHNVAAPSHCKGGSSTKVLTSAGSTSMSWTSSSNQSWTISAASFKPATDGGGGGGVTVRANAYMTPNSFFWGH